MWTVLAAMILLFFGMFIVLFTCFSARKERRRTPGTYKNGGDAYVARDGVYDNGTTTHANTTTTARGTRRKRFGLF